MSGFLAHLAARSLGRSPAVRPRLPSLFEPPGALPGAGPGGPGDAGDPRIVERDAELAARLGAAGRSAAGRRPAPWSPAGEPFPARLPLAFEPLPAPPGPAAAGAPWAEARGGESALAAPPVAAPASPARAVLEPTREAWTPPPVAPHPTVAAAPLPGSATGGAAAAGRALPAPAAPSAAPAQPAAARWAGRQDGAGRGLEALSPPAPLSPASLQGPVAARPEVLMPPPDAAIARFATARPAAEPVIRVTIGRVEVRAVAEAAAPAAGPPQPAAARRGAEPSLEDYLERRARRER